MKSHRRFKNIARSLEVLFSAMFLSWLVSRSFPYFSAILELSCLFLNRFSTLLLNHHFVFLLGNAIIAALLLKFGCEKQSVADVVDEYVIDEVVVPPVETISSEILPLEAVYEENQIIPAEIGAVPVARRNPEVNKCSSLCRRWRSIDFELAKGEKIQLQRSDTTLHRKLENFDKETAADVDDLSNEEFQRRVEEFIARQQKFLRDDYCIYLNRLKLKPNRTQSRF